MTAHPSDGSFFARAYLRLGRRYPGALLALQFPFAFALSGLAVAALRLYVDMSGSRFAAVLALGLAMTTIGVAVSIVQGRRLLTPVRRWIEGARGREASEAAWRAAVALPARVWPGGRAEQTLILLLVLPLLFTAGAALVLDLSLAGALAILTAAALVAAYGAVLNYLVLESGIRPVVSDISRALPADFDLGPVQVPLRWKLLAGLPAINAITGILVAGLTSPEQGIRALEIDALAATAIASAASIVIVLYVSDLVLRPLQRLVAATNRMERGELETRVPLATRDEFGQLAQSFNRMVIGLAQRERIRSAFGSYLDHEVAERVLDEGPSLAGEEIEATVVFVDVVGFTAFAEPLEPREVVSTLNELFELVVPAVVRFDGHVDKFIGDGVLSVFGAFDRAEDHADRALDAALAILRSVDRVFGESLRVGIGMDSGPVVAGTIGGGGRLQFTVIGGTVNAAFRVQEATRSTGDRLLITESTHRLLHRTSAKLEKRPDVHLRGRQTPVALYAPVDA